MDLKIDCDSDLADSVGFDLPVGECGVKGPMSTAVIIAGPGSGTMEPANHSFHCFDGFPSPEKCHHSFHYHDGFLLTAIAFLDNKPIW